MRNQSSTSHRYSERSISNISNTAGQHNKVCNLNTSSKIEVYFTALNSYWMSRHMRLKMLELNTVQSCFWAVTSSSGFSLSDRWVCLCWRSKVTHRMLSVSLEMQTWNKATADVFSSLTRYILKNTTNTYSTTNEKLLLIIIYHNIIKISSDSSDGFTDSCWSKSLGVSFLNISQILYI